jgi:hypothetical protein
VFVGVNVGVGVGVFVAVAVGVSVAVKVAVGVALGPLGVLVANENTVGTGVFVPGRVIGSWAKVSCAAPDTLAIPIRIRLAASKPVIFRIKRNL